MSTAPPSAPLPCSGLLYLVLRAPVGRCTDLTLLRPHGRPGPCLGSQRSLRNLMLRDWE